MSDAATLPDGIARLRLPPKIVALFSGVASVRAAYGGRGSGKTRGFALMSAVKGMMLGLAGLSGVILCGREHLNSLDESSMEEIKQAIRSEPWLEDYWDIGEKYIRSKDGRIRYVFAGLRHNLDSLKSKARILIAWIDEAEGVSEVAWSKLIPTVREEGAEIWVTWNPESEESATNRRFRIDPPEGARVARMNYTDNPFFPAILEKARLDDLRKRPETYGHVWEGEYLTLTKAQIFGGKYRLAKFEPTALWNGPYYGVDFGFSQDPTTGVEVWVHDDRLWVRRDKGKVGLELDETAPFLKRWLPGIERYVSRADSARPESISYLKRHGLRRMTGVKKWQGSVEDGIEHLKSYEEIVVHEEDALGTAREMRLYSYKVDRLTGDVLPVVLDDHNHYIDAIRYAVVPLMQKTGYNLTEVL